MGAVEASRVSLDYYHMRPYPQRAFGPLQWPLDKGPVPTPLPFAAILIDEGAEFVFRGGAPRFTVADSDDANDFLAAVIKSNQLDSRWVPLAKRNGNLGTLAVKWSYDSDNEDRPVQLAFLSVPEECRVWVDPHDQTRILMARVQYPYRDPTDSHWYYFREEWTDDRWVTYEPKHAGDESVTDVTALPGYSNDLGDKGDWVITDESDNPFGVIPITLIKNRAVEGQLLGIGDVWGSYKLMDRIALTMHGEDKSNQMHSEPNLVITNALLKNDGPLMPNEPIAVSNTNPDGPPADVKLLEPSGNARQYSHLSIEKWLEWLWAQVGMSRVDAATVTNKGNMTRAVFEMLYARTIATSNHKRTAWGEGGLGPMFSRMLTGLARVGAVSVAGISLPAIDRPDVTVTWPDYFEATDQDLEAVTDRTISQVGGGMLSEERGARRIASREGHPPHEVEAIAQEAVTAKEAKDAAARAAATPAPTGSETPILDSNLTGATTGLQAV